jgi:hypothetical protein
LKKKNQAKPTAMDLLRADIEAGRVARTVHTDLILYQHDMDFEHQPASWPTASKAGSREKVLIMRLRVELGESPFHPDDNRQQVVAERGPTAFSLRDLFPVSEPVFGRKSLSQ